MISKFLDGLMLVILSFFITSVVLAALAGIFYIIVHERQSFYIISFFLVSGWAIVRWVEKKCGEGGYYFGDDL